jgi:hypothetical protein
MVTSKENSSAKARAKFGRARTIAALSIAAVTFAGAAVKPQSTSAASTLGSSTLEVQVQTLRECEEGLDYGRLDSFEGMLSDFACIS